MAGTATLESGHVASFPTAAANPHYSFIDGLRAVAVLAVIAYHVDSRVLPGGFVGVDVFFVISGFVVSGSVVGFRERRPISFAMRFAARRVRRIVPALLVCVSLTQLFAILLVPGSTLTPGVDKAGLRALVGLSNRVFAAGLDYFALTTDFNPFTHTWSLGVEEQFYVLFPVVFLAWLVGGWWRRLSVGIVLATFVYSLLHARELSLGGERTYAFYATSTRLWQIAAGVALFQLASRRGRVPADGVVPAKWRGAVLAVSAIALVAAFVAARPSHVPWPDGVLPAAATVGVLACLVDKGADTRLRRLLSAPPLVSVGLLSYSLYLWHWPVLVLFRWTVGLGSPAYVLVAVACIVALASASYRFVEQPIRRGKRVSNLPPWIVIVAAVALVAGAYAATTQALARRTTLSASVVMRHFDRWAPGGGAVAPSAAGCTVNTKLLGVGAAMVLQMSQDGCDRIDARSLFAIGDSHAGAYQEMLRTVVRDTGVTVHLLGQPGCAFALMNVATARVPVCARVIEDELAYLDANVRSGDVLFLPALRQQPLSDEGQRLDVGSILASPDRSSVSAASVARTQRLLAPLVQRGVKVLFPAPLPLFAAPPFRCADWFNRHNPVCGAGFAMSREVLERYRAPVLDALEELASSLPAAVWDPLPELCDPTTCRAFKAGQPLFYDGDHLTGLGNRQLVASFEIAMRDLSGSQ